VADAVGQGFAVELDTAAGAVAAGNGVAACRRPFDGLAVDVDDAAPELDLVARQAELRALRQEAEEVVGGVTYENFTGVRKRFRDLVIKADVGILDVSWLRKEEHTSRGTDLSRARAKELRQLDEEFREVRGGSDAAEQPAPAVEE